MAVSGGRFMGAGSRGGTAPREKPQNLLPTLLRVLGYLRENRLLVAFVVLALLVSSASSIAGSYFLRPLINDYILPGDFSGLAGALATLAVIYLAGVLANYAQARTTVRLAQRTTNAMRRELFERMQELPIAYYDAHAHGELMSRFTNDMDNVQTMLEQSLTQILSSAILFAGAVSLMFFLNPVLFVATALVLAAMIFASRRIGRASQGYFQETQAVLGALNGNIEEAMGGLREIKAFNHEEVALQKFAALNESYRENATRANFFAGMIMPIMVNLNNISYAISAVFGGLLTLQGAFDVGSLASYLQFSRQIGQPINQITNQMNNIYAAVAGAERIFAMMDERSEVDEGGVTLARRTHGWAWVFPDGHEVELAGDVRFEGVTFSYDGVKTVLSGISLYAEPGQIIAFVGSTGAGKTTITNLINRFYEVQVGTITYDGIDVRMIAKESLRRSLGMVLQDTHLFTGSVLDNIRYGRLEATNEECVEAARKASANSFIKRLPNGYDTQLTGDGANLSQGQRQLLAIARAYIAGPPVMILDEATSSIDTRTERRLQKGMNELMKGRTVFVIAHRLSTVRNAKAIMVLEHGRIVERGSHEELLADRGRYYQLYTGLSELE